MPVYNTKQRRILLDYLSEHTDRRLTAAMIAGELKNQGISLSAVYRNLAALEADGRVRRNTKGGSREAYYQFVDDDGCREHLHLYCKKCGKTFHMATEETAEVVNSVAVNDNFKIDKADTVLYGVCRLCQE